jgi:predicted MFS family arabinose efflux permease
MHGQGRPLSVIMRQPMFVVAALAAALSYGVMNLLMAATPLAMQVCGFDFKSTATVLQWHVIGMFAPGFFTGSLIKKFGVLRIMGAGVLLNLICIAVALSGAEVTDFLISSFLLGIGWNFIFTGSTTLSLQAYRPEEKDRAQGAINFCVFATMAVSSFSSGALLTTQGWTMLNMGSVAPVCVIAVALIWTMLRMPIAPKP